MCGLTRQIRFIGEDGDELANLVGAVLPVLLPGRPNGRCVDVARGTDGTCGRVAGSGHKASGRNVSRLAEGPVYSADGGVYFTDSINDRIMRFAPGTRLGDPGAAKVFRSPAGRANGLAFDLEGRLLACESNQEGGNRRVTRTEKDGRITVLADHYHGKRLNSPNDIDIDAQGRIYFTDPRYGDRSDMELEKECVYRIDRDGTLTCIIDDAERPNGLQSPRIRRLSM